MEERWGCSWSLLGREVGCGSRGCRVAIPSGIGCPSHLEKSIELSCSELSNISPLPLLGRGVLGLSASLLGAWVWCTHPSAFSTFLRVALLSPSERRCFWPLQIERDAICKARLSTAAGGEAPRQHRSVRRGRDGIAPDLAPHFSSPRSPLRPRLTAAPAPASGVRFARSALCPLRPAPLPAAPPPAPLPSFGVSPFASNSNGEPGGARRHGQPVPCLRPSLRRRADFGEPPAALEPLGAGRWAARGGRAGDSPPTPAGRTPLLLEGVGLGAGSRGRGGETGRKAAGRGSGLPAADGSERGGSNE